MAASAKVYAQGRGDVLNGVIDLATAALKVALFPATYTPNQDTDHHYADIKAQEITGAGYTAGGAAVTGQALAYDAPTNKWTLSFDPVVWDPSTFTARIAVLYVATGTDATATLLSWLDAGADQTSSNGAQTVNGDGGWTLTDTLA